MKAEELGQILDFHKKWLADEEGGQRANLRNANLSFADLSYADLSYADLSDANLKIFHAGLWPAYITSTHIRIGCQYHLIEDWFGFRDAAIERMHPQALDCWRANKPILRAIIASLREKFPLQKEEPTL